MAIMTLENAAFGYDGRKIVKNLSFCVNEGDYLCIVGENGAGKSTLMRGMLQLIPPMEGKVSLGEHFKRKQIGYLPQQTDSKPDFPASVSEIVLTGRLNRVGWHPFFTKEDKKIALRNMESLEVADLADRSFRDLSGGQKQRVLLARALCASDKLLLLDEPTAGLDPIATPHLYRLIAEINRERGLAIVMITHDISAAVRYGSHILHIGQDSAFFGTVDEYSASPYGTMFFQGGNHA